MFCYQTDFSDSIIDMLTKSVIDLKKDDIRKVYEYWQSGFDEIGRPIPPDVQMAPEKKLIYPSLSVSDEFVLTGIDFPIWFQKSGNLSTNRIMIVGIDPLRNDKSFEYIQQPQARVLIGTPYAIHDKKLRNGRTRNYWTFINRLAENNLVYLTDIYKTFFYTSSSKSERSYNYYRRENKVDAHRKILQSEIDLVRPNLIITFGAESFLQLFSVDYCPKLTARIQDNSRKYRDTGIEVLPMVHLSGSTRKHTHLEFIKENGLTYSPDRTIGDHYFQIIDNCLSQR